MLGGANVRGGVWCRLLKVTTGVCVEKRRELSNTAPLAIPLPMPGIRRRHAPRYEEEEAEDSARPCKWTKSMRRSGSARTIHSKAPASTEPRNHKKRKSWFFPAPGQRLNVSRKFREHADCEPPRACANAKKLLKAFVLIPHRRRWPSEGSSDDCEKKKHNQPNMPGMKTSGLPWPCSMM